MNCCDNAVAERFFHTLKTEPIHHEDFQTGGFGGSATISSTFLRTSSFELISSWPYEIIYFWLLGQVLCEAQRREHSRSYVTGVVTKHSA